ncbi:MAG TPA: GNAT family N-acetyltransferase [Xanthobacteraceae bacterium]|nr:GNAT family N-acetyltransferase [Xanthobacteraceae bacterium]
MSAIVPSAELIRRTIDTEVAYTLSRMRVLERIEGNPIGIAYRRVGANGWALAAPHLPTPSFNRVVGLEAGDESELAGLVDWYRGTRAKPQFELVPGFATPALMRALAQLGYRQSDFHAAVVVRPQDAVASDPAVDVVRVTTREQFEDFLSAYVAGWGIAQAEGFKRNVRPWLNEEGWSMFLGRADGVPAAIGILYLRDGCGYLADAATDPKFRGRGLQTALLAHRLRHAASEGAEYVSSGATFLSTSHRNMVRAGMSLHFVRALWTAG